MISIEVEYITATCVIITFIQFAPDETERCRERKGRTMSASSKQKMLQSSHASFKSSVLLHTCNHPTPTPPGSRPTCLLKLAFHLVTGVPCVMHQHFSFFTTLNHLFLFGQRSQRGSEEALWVWLYALPNHPQALWSPHGECLVSCVARGAQLPCLC